MHTPRRPSRRLARSLGLALAVLIVPVLAGCSSGTVPSASPTPSAPPPSASPSGAPSADPSSSVGTDLPLASEPAVIDPAGKLVVPAPGQLDVHPISAEALSAAISGRRVVITIAYTSGVAPCSILDSIMVQKGSGSFAITLREGHGPGDPICMMMAESKRTQVDLGELEPGDYRISDATGGAPPIVVTVS
jgi:hypothetical protein